MNSSALVSAMESYNKALSELRQASVEQEFGCAVVGEWYHYREDCAAEYIYLSSVVFCPQEGDNVCSYQFAGWKLAFYNEIIQIHPITLCIESAKELSERYLSAGVEPELVSFAKPMLESLALSFGALVEKY